jgi:carbamoyl-phosphate synthase small subunit
MKYYTKQAAVLMLQDGTVIHGSSIGMKGTHGGEICFNTGMTGYQEVYTDPSYYGQVIINTNAHIGNYGVLDLEQESGKPTISGLIVNSFSQIASRKTSDERLQDYLEVNNIVGIADIDTRQLVRHIRSKGAMNCIISSEIHDLDELKKELDKIPDMKGLELSTEVTTSQAYDLGSANDGFKVAVLDLGIKKSILSNLTERGCELKVFPAKTSFQEMEAWGANGYFVSNGPGDPAAMPYAVDAVKEMMAADKPVFGICLGHQILALANGIATYKMHHGHRGLNHPVKNLETGLSEITSQNHGFAVDADSLQASDKVEVTHVNLNDNTIEGFRVKHKKAFSVQYHPESSPGPHDSRYLFDQFINLLKAN